MRSAQGSARTVVRSGTSSTSAWPVVSPLGHHPSKCFGRTTTSPRTSRTRTRSLSGTPAVGSAAKRSAAMRLPRRIPLASDPATITVSRLFVSTRARQRATNSLTSGVGMSRVDVIWKILPPVRGASRVSAAPDSATITDRPSGSESAPYPADAGSSGLIALPDHRPLGVRSSVEIARLARGVAVRAAAGRPDSDVSPDDHRSGLGVVATQPGEQTTGRKLGDVAGRLVCARQNRLARADFEVVERGDRQVSGNRGPSDSAASMTPKARKLFAVSSAVGRSGCSRSSRRCANHRSG